MSTYTTSILQRLGFGRTRPSDALTDRILSIGEPITLFTMVVAYVLTVGGLEAGFAVENNPIAAALFAELGYAGMGVLMVASTAATFRLLSWVKRIIPLTVSIGAVALALVSIANAGSDLLFVLTADADAPIVPSAVAGTVAFVALLAGAWVLRRYIVAAVRTINATVPVNGGQFRAITLAFLMVASLPVAFSGGFGVIDGAHDGTALAAEGDDIVLENEWSEPGENNAGFREPMAIRHSEGEIYAVEDGGSNALHIYDKETGELIDTDNSNDYTDTRFGFLMFSEDEQYFYTGTNDNENIIKVDADTFEEVERETTPTGGSNILGFDIDVDILALAGNEGVQIYDTETLEKVEHLNTISANGAHGVKILDDRILVNDRSDNLQVFDRGTYDEIDSFDVGESGPSIVYDEPRGNVILSGTSSSHQLKIYDLSTGTEVASGSTTGANHMVALNDEKFAMGSSSAIEIRSMETGEVLESASDEQKFRVGVGDGSIYTTSDGYGLQKWNTNIDTVASEPITGQVVDQHGDPVPNATVAAHGIAESALDESDARSLEEQAEDLRDELTDPVPDEWDEFVDEYELDDGLVDSDALSSDVDGTYPMVHAEDDWSTGLTTIISTEVDDPRMTVDSGETVILSQWDVNKDGGWTDTSPVRSSHPGAPTDGTIVVEQLSPTGEVTNSQELDTSVEFVEDRYLGSDREWHAVRTQLSTGVYQVYPEDNEGARYTVVVGDPDELWSSWESDLEDQADQLTQRADRIQSMLSDERVVRKTVQTDENGGFEVEMPSAVVTTDLQAMKVDGKTLAAVEDPSLEDMRQAQLGGYNGSFYLPSPSANTVEAPAEGVTVTTYRSPEVPLSDIGGFADLMAFLEDQRLDEDLEDLESLVDTRLEDLEQQNLEEIRDQLEELADDQGVLDDIEETESLEKRIEELESELADAEKIEPGDGSGSLADGLLDYKQAFSGDIDAAMATVEYENGDVETVPDEYVEIESGGLFGGDTVSINEYPIDGDRSVADVTIRASGSGGVGTAGGTIPADGVDLPGVDAVNFNTLAPGADERVHVGIDPADGSGYDSLSAVEVFSPDGAVLESSIDGTRDRATFRTDGVGVHHVRLTFDTDHGEFTVNERLRALENPRSEPATIRASSGPTGPYAVVGEVLESASVDVDGGEMDITAVLEGDGMISSLHIHPESELDSGHSEIHVSLVRGSDEQTVHTHMETVFHFQNNYDENTIAWRNDDAIAYEGGTRYGEVIPRTTPNGEEKHVLRTYTDENGQVTVETIQSPTRIQRLHHWTAKNLPSPNIPFIGSVVPSLPSGSGLVGVAIPFVTYWGIRRWT